MKFQIATAAERDNNDLEPIEVPGNEDLEVEGRTLMMRRPTPSQFALAMASAADPYSAEASRDVVRLFKSLFSGEDWAYLEGRIWDGDDEDITFEGLSETFHQVFKEKWSADPTQRSSNYSGSPKRTGAKSTAPSRKRASTR